MNFFYIALGLLLIWLFVKRGDIWAMNARALYSKGQIPAALKRYETALKLGGVSDETKLLYAYLLLRTGSLDRARTQLNLIRMSVGAKPAVKNRVKSLLAILYWKEDDLDLAIEVMEEVVENYKTTTVYQNLGLFYVLRGEAERALEFCLEAYDYNSEDLIILDNLAKAYELAGEREKSAETYEKLMELNPHFPEAYYGYGKLLIDMGEHEKGTALIEQSLEKPFTFLSVKQKDEVEAMLLR